MSSLIPISLALLIAASLAPPESLSSQTPTPQQQTSASSAETTRPAQPNPDKLGKYHVGDGVAAPRLISQVQPQFPENALSRISSGACIVAFTVNIDGTPENVHITKSFADGVTKKQRPAALTLDDTCVKTVEQYRFQPAIYQNKPVPVDLKVKIDF